MKRSAAVTLVLSGSLLVGCDRNGGNGVPGNSASQSLTNNTYQPGYGYWHSGYGRWYPYPHNFYRNGWGYYYDGSWWNQPDTRPAPAAAPASYSSGGRSSFWGSGSGSSSHSSISRGGFGSSAHSASS